MLLLQQVGLPMESALALGGASGIAVGLATQDIVKNLLGGVVIATRRPFRLGDKVSTGALFFVFHGFSPGLALLFDLQVQRCFGSPAVVCVRVCVCAGVCVCVCVF